MRHGRQWSFWTKKGRHAFFVGATCNYPQKETLIEVMTSEKAPSTCKNADVAPLAPFWWCNYYKIQHVGDSHWERRSKTPKMSLFWARKRPKYPFLLPQKHHRLPVNMPISRHMHRDLRFGDEKNRIYSFWATLIEYLLPNFTISPVLGTKMPQNTVFGRLSLRT